MKKARLIVTILLITLVAVVLVYFATLSVNISGIHSTDFTAADLIRDRQPIRIIQPEWVSGDDGLLSSWMSSEIKARVALVGIVWLSGIVFTVRNYKKRKHLTLIRPPESSTKRHP